jgi:hypothetical protein
MDDADGMGGGECCGNLHGEPDRLRKWKMAAAEPRTERLALDQFHRDVPLAVRRLAQCVDVSDVWMIECRGRPGLLLKSADPQRIARDRFRQELQSHVSAECLLVRGPNLSHPSRTE